MTLTVASTFSGVGGFDLAAQRAGLSVAWQCEIDPRAQSVLRYRFPGVPLYADIREVGTDARPVQPVDVLCGGFPCQDLSVAGARAGLAGERSGLFHELVRLARVLAPRWLLFENVPGLLSSNGGRDMGAVVGALVELGYGVAWCVLDAQHFGVPQRRRRVFIVGCAGGDHERAASVLLESAGVPGDSPAGGEAGEDVAGCLGGQPAGGGWRDDTDRATFVAFAQNQRDEVRVSPTVGALAAQPGMKQQSFIAATLTSGIGRTGNAPGRRREDDENLVASFQQNSMSGRGSLGFDPDTRVLRPVKPQGDHQMIAACLTTRNERIDAETETLIPTAFQCHGSNVGPMGVIRAGNGNETGGVPFLPAGFGVRRLMPVECERLQGFPDGWTEFGAGGKPQSDAARYRQIGNAVAVPVVEWIFRRLVAADAALREPAPGGAA